MNFAEYFDLCYVTDELLGEGISLGTYSGDVYDEKDVALKELRADAEIAFQSVVKYAQDKKNWMTYNLPYWIDHKEQMINMAIGYLRKYMLSMGMLNRGDARQKARDFISSQWQKDVGLGGRRHFQRLQTMGLGHDLGASTGEIPASLPAVMIKKRGPGTPKGEYLGVGKTRRRIKSPGYELM